MFTHPFLTLLAQSNPSVLSIVLDGIEIYRAIFTDQGLKPLIERSVQRGEGNLLTFHLDDNPKPAYFLFLRSPPEAENTLAATATF
ncbi:MAG: hypothetical protein AAF050_00670 [Cyanobacteria bacterium J06649_5]